MRYRLVIEMDEEEADRQLTNDCPESTSLDWEANMSGILRDYGSGISLEMVADTGVGGVIKT